MVLKTRCPDLPPSACTRSLLVMQVLGPPPPRAPASKTRGAGTHNLSLSLSRRFGCLIEFENTDSDNWKCRGGARIGMGQWRLLLLRLHPPVSLLKISILQDGKPKLPRLELVAWFRAPPGGHRGSYRQYWVLQVVQSLKGVGLCNSMDCMQTVHHQLPEFAQTHVC